MFGQGAIYEAGQAAAVDTVLLDRVSINETYAAYTDTGCTHADQWAASKRHQFTVDTNFSATRWAALVYDLPGLGLNMTDFANVEVRNFSNTVPKSAILDIAVGISNSSATAPSSANTSVVSFTFNTSVSFIYRTLNLDGLSNYSTSGYDYLFVGYRYRPSSGNPNAMTAWLYNVELKV